MQISRLMVCLLHISAVVASLIADDDYDVSATPRSPMPHFSNKKVVWTHGLNVEKVLCYCFFKRKAIDVVM